jgi:hypothetical protein
MGWPLAALAALGTYRAIRVAQRAVPHPPATEAADAVAVDEQARPARSDN